MVIVYALCWLPLHCVTVLGDLRPSIWNFEHIQLVWIACHWLAVSSCCWNPIVYYWTNDTLRAGFTYALGTWCPCVRRPATPHVAPCRRHVVYQTTLRGSELPVDGDIRRTARHPSSLLYYRARRVNLGKTNNVEMRQFRSPTSARYSMPSPSAARAVTQSY